MTGAHQPTPAPGRPEASPPAADRDGEVRAAGPFRRWLAGGTWVGSLICVPFLVFFIFFGVRAAQLHRWASFAGFLVVAVLFLIIPAGGLRRLGRRLKGRKPPGLPPSAL